MRDSSSIDAGRLSHRIAIESPGPSTADVNGYDVATWVAVGTYWAEVRPLDGREAIVAKQRRPEATSAVTVRASAKLLTLTAGSRFTFRGRTFNLLEVLDRDSRRVELTILAVELPPTGA